MIITTLQLNTNSDNFWGKLSAFLLKANIDILMLQELTGVNTIFGNINSKRDTFKDLQQLLNTQYNGELAIGNRFSSTDSAYMGNAIFYKKSFPLISKNIFFQNKIEDPYSSGIKTSEGLGRNILHLQLLINNKNISFLTTHGAWAPTPIEHPHQTTQGEKIINYLKTVTNPFIFSGDFNLSTDQPLIQKISGLARNLIIENQIKNTLNPRLHHVKELFPKGVAVDYIFTSTDLQVKNFTVLEDDLSDHLGLTAKIEI